jgi:hypothetical protein
VERRRPAVIASFTLATIGIIIYLAFNFKINDDLTNMISEKLPFHQMEKETGDVILNYENLTTVRESVGMATFAFLLLVALISLF